MSVTKDLNLLAETIIDSWDMKTTLCYAREQLIEFWIENPEAYMFDWETHFGVKE